MRCPGDRAERGQVSVMIGASLVVLLGLAGVAIDGGRLLMERRHIQNAADAAALAGCRALIDGASDFAAAQAARDIAQINLERSPAAGTSTIAADASPVYEDGHAGDPAYLVSGIAVTGTGVRVAIQSTVDTALGRVVGVDRLDTGARARCTFVNAALPIVARRYSNAPGPGGGFVDHVATAATSTLGRVDPNSVLGYDGVRTPASATDPGPTFALYGPNSKAANDASFRGFIALDIRNFATTTSRIYYNGVASGTNPNTIKQMQGEYIVKGYPGPGFPPVTTPPDPNDQVAVLNGNDTPMVVGNFDDVYRVGDEVLVALYNGTVMSIPDFSITPPAWIDVPSTGTVATGPTFAVGRNDAFNSTVTLFLHGDAAAASATPPHPEYDLIAEPPSHDPPSAGDMNMPNFDPNVFIPEQRGTTVRLRDISTNAVPAGIYTVWLRGKSGDPYFQERRYPVAVRAGGATRDFSLANSTTTGHAAAAGNAISLPIYVSTAASGTTAWGSAGGAVQLSIDAGTLPASLVPSQVALSPASVTPSSSGSGALSTLTIDTAGLSPGYYTFNLRATGTNGDTQPVTHVQPISFTVVNQPSNGSYVDIIGFSIFRVTALGANSIEGQAITGAYADPNDPALRRVQEARLIPWE